MRHLNTGSLKVHKYSTKVAMNCQKCSKGHVFTVYDCGAMTWENICTGCGSMLIAAKDSIRVIERRVRS